MTEREISSCKKCRVCTGCGRGAKGQEGLQVVSDFTVPGDNGRENSRPEADENAMVIAVDIGTTTIVMQLRRIKDGKVLDTFRAINPQRKYGMDVLSRIQAAETAGADMQYMVCDVLKQGIKQFQDAQWGSAKGAGEDIKGMVIAANTTMIHLLMGYPVNTLGKAPFVSEHLEEIQTEIGGVPTVIMPGISAFVGADILAGMYACETYFGEGNPDRVKKGETFLFLDLGTNGEMVLGTGDKMLATATAAGPAFEGRLDANVWGADAIHFLATLYKEGLVDETGLLADEYFEQGVTVGSIVMTQADIRSLQLAKAAVNAGIQVLREAYAQQGISCIDKVYLAGGFGYFLNPKDAVTIGLLPGELETKCIPVGNAALEGAFCYGRERLCDNRERAKAALKKAVDLKEKTQIYNLAETENFEKYYIESINLSCTSKD